ncbi:MAG: hypothetical protein RR204_06055, partial [Raoultibacter sp.]
APWWAYNRSSLSRLSCAYVSTLTSSSSVFHDYLLRQDVPDGYVVDSTCGRGAGGLFLRFVVTWLDGKSNNAGAQKNDGKSKKKFLFASIYV